MEDTVIHYARAGLKADGLRVLIGSTLHLRAKALADQGYITECSLSESRRFVTFRTTSAGRDYLARNELQ